MTGIMKLFKKKVLRRSSADKLSPFGAMDSSAMTTVAALEDDSSEMMTMAPELRFMAHLLEAFGKGDNETFMNAFDDDCQVHFEEADMNFADFFAQTNLCFESFPDLRFHKIQMYMAKDNVVAVDAYVTGTHTGKPFCFGPFPEIAATNKRIRVDPERSFYTLQKNQATGDDESSFTITDLTIKPLGESTGPAAIYEQIGGVVI